MTAGSFGEAVSAVGRKLEIHGAFRPGTTKAIGELAGKLADPAVFGAFAEVCSRDAPFVVAMTRLARQARREETKK